jgi:hypothetical protein
LYLLFSEKKNHFRGEKLGRFYSKTDQKGLEKGGEKRMQQETQAMQVKVDFSGRK